MRNATTYLLSVILIAGALSAVVSMATVTWLYPKRGSFASQAAATTAVTPAAQPTTAPPQQTPKIEPKPDPKPDPGPAKPAGAEEQLALDFFRKAATGDIAGALALTGGSITKESVQEQITWRAPTPQRVARLPAPTGAVPVLVWVTYGREGARGLYQVTIAGGKVTALKGLMSPEEGYGPLPQPLLDEQARQLDLSPYKGRGLVLISPRKPEADLAELLADLSVTFAPKGVDVILVLDMRSPDYTAAARDAGYKGPVWRYKGKLEDVPMVAKGSLHGAYGLLIDRDSIATGAIGALEPLNYDLPDEAPRTIAPTVFRAYGLTP